MKIFKKELKLNIEEQQIVDVVREMVNHKDCSIEVNPENMHYLINVETLDYFAHVDDIGVEISNHKFFISSRLRSAVIDKVKSLIIEEKSRRWHLKKDTIFENKTNLLDKIKNNINP